MSEDLYAEPDFTKKVGLEPGEKEERIVDIYVSVNSLRIYDDPCDARTVQQHPVTISSEEKKPVRASAVCLGVLCLHLLAGIIALALYCSTIKTSCDAERDLLLKSFNNVTEERDQLRRTNDDVTRERDQLQTSYNNLTRQFTGVCQALLQQSLPSTVRHFGYSCYYISTEKKTWKESRQDCQSRGADLVIMNSKEEQDAVTSFKKRAWIGLTDEDEENTWRWVDGTRLTSQSYENWNRNQPDNADTGEDCAELYRKSSYKWNDFPCQSTNYWICEKRIVA